MAEQYQQHLTTFMQTVMALGQKLQQGEVETALANSAVFLDMMGKMVIGWLWLEMADKAVQQFNDSDAAEDQQFLAGKLQAAQYFIRWEMGEINHQAQLLTSFDETCLSMQTEWF